MSTKKSDLQKSKQDQTTVVLQNQICDCELVIFFFFLILSFESESCSVVSDLCDLMDRSPPGSPVCGIFQARILEWVAVSYSLV